MWKWFLDVIHVSAYTNWIDRCQSTNSGIRKMARRYALLCLFAFLGVSSAFSQGRQVSGTVTDKDSGIPIPGVNVAIEGTTLGTTTALDGSYTIAIRSGSDVLIFSFIGYQASREVIGDRTTIDVALAEDVVLLNEVVVVGYGTQKRGEITGSVSTLDAGEANIGLVTSSDQMLRGRVAGVNIVQNNGEPGSAFVVRIRGGTSISASNEPLYVIDGVPIDNSPTSPGGIGIGGASAPLRNPLNTLNPNDIESLTVLKDASATAIYGSRGANGVILITTKKGSAGRLTVDYDGYVSSSSLTNKIDLLSASAYRNFIQEQVSAGNLSQAALDILGSANTDWQDEVTRNAVTQSHNLALSGGTADAQYRVSLGYMSNQGLIIGSGLDRLTGRLNATQNSLGGSLRFALNLSTAYTEDNYIPYTQTGGFEGALITNVLSYNPTFPVHDATGDFFETGVGRQSVRNPVALANEVADKGKTTRTLGNFSAELDLSSDLTFKVNFGADRSQATRRIYLPKSSPVGDEFGGRASQGNLERSSYTLQSYLTYDRSFDDKHAINVLGGYEYNEFILEQFGAEARDFVTDVTGFNALQSGAELINPFSNKEKSKLISFFGRANYNFKERYYLTGVLRYDGSSRFGSGNQWALFPAISGAWRIGDEAFMSDGVFSDLRLKVGWGIVGSQEIGNNLSIAQLRADTGSRAVLGGVPVTGIAPANFANPDLKWEETTSVNVGVDFGLQDGKYSGTIEWYRKNTTDLLLEIPVPQPAPVPTRLENIGEVRNTGLDVSFNALAYQGTDLKVDIGGVFNTNNNEVISLGPRDEIITGTVSGRGQSDTFAQVIRPGEPLGSFFGPVFTSVENGAQQFADLDGDGTVEINSDDRKILGNAQPDFTYGIRAAVSWKEFDLSVFVRGEQGRDIFNNTALVYETKSSATQNQNFIATALGDGTILTEPAKFSSRYIEDGSFLRLDNLTLGYAFDASKLSEYGRRARVYVSVQNLFVLTGYNGYDPEVNTSAGLATLGIDYTNYPRPRTVTLGVSIGF
jgi:TonB-dependent starch-binding outer membrane protein SusC